MRTYLVVIDETEEARLALRFVALLVLLGLHLAPSAHGQRLIASSPQKRTPAAPPRPLEPLTKLC